MTRINLATDLKTRTGAPDKDARLKNAYVEVRGESSAVRRRPSAQGGIAVGSGVAQGGIGFNIGGTDYFIGVWGDVSYPATIASLSSGTTWNSSTTYLIGDSYEEYDNNGADPFEEPPSHITYYALAENTNKPQASNPELWGVTPPPATRWTADGTEWTGTETVHHYGYGSSKISAAEASFAQYLYTECPGAVPGYIWQKRPLELYGGIYARLDQWTGAVCPGTNSGPVIYITLTQTA